MKIFYCGSTVNRNPLMAGAIHLGDLPVKRLPTAAELKPIWGSGSWNRDQWGKPVFLGADQIGNEVYALLLGTDPDMGLQVIYHLLNQVSDPLQWKFFKIRDKTSRLLSLGFFCTRRLKLTALGDFLATRGFRTGYYDLVNQVRQVKGGDFLGKA